MQLSIKKWESLRYVNKISIMCKIKYLLKQVSKIPTDILPLSLNILAMCNELLRQRIIDSHLSPTSSFMFAQMRTMCAWCKYTKAPILRVSILILWGMLCFSVAGLRPFSFSPEKKWCLLCLCVCCGYFFLVSVNFCFSFEYFTRAHLSSWMEREKWCLL